MGEQFARLHEAITIKKGVSFWRKLDHNHLTRVEYARKRYDLYRFSILTISRWLSGDQVIGKIVVLSRGLSGEKLDHIWWGHGPLVGPPGRKEDPLSKGILTPSARALIQGLLGDHLGVQSISRLLRGFYGIWFGTGPRLDFRYLVRISLRPHRKKPGTCNTRPPSI
jgi:hypothetical protein